MHGPFILEEEIIDRMVKKGIMGNYTLGFANRNGSIMSVNYVGRSDTDLNRRLKDVAALSVEIAYIKECHDYHIYIDNGFRLDNENHPRKTGEYKFSMSLLWQVIVFPHVCRCVSL
jgi:hypothetical protein